MQMTNQPKKALNNIAKFFIIVVVSHLFFAPTALLAKEPSDPFYPQQIYLSNIYAPQAWNTVTDASDIIVAVIDAGVDIDHEDLKNNIWKNDDEIPGNGIDYDGNGFIDDVYGWDFINDAPDPRPKFEDGFSEFAMQHGTVVSGIIGASGGNGIGTSGIAWKVKIMPLRALNSRGTGDIVAIVRALNYARQNGADVINLSLVGDESSSMLEIELDQAYKEGIVVVAASGNEGINLNEFPRYPICNKGPKGEDWILGVSAIDFAGRKAKFANYGDDCVDISAPGVNIFSTQFTSNLEPGYANPYMGKWSGTSVAAPQITGAVAMIKSQNPNLSVDEIREIIISEADNIDDVNPLIPGMLGGGRINLEKIMQNDLIKFNQNVKERAIVTGAGPGGGPHVKVYDSRGVVRQQFFAYDDPNYSEGVYAKLGDVTGDGKTEVVISSGKGVAPIIQVYDSTNKKLSSFLAYEKDMQSGVELSVFDVDADGKSEIITVPRNGSSPLVRVFDDSGKLKREFFVFMPSLKSGARMDVADVDNDGLGEIVVVPDANLTPVVRVYSYHGFLEREFYPYDTGVTRILTVGAGPGIIAVGNGKGNSPEVKTFNYKGDVIDSWIAYSDSFNGGINVSVSDIDDDGILEIITGPQRGGGPHLRIFNPSGRIIAQWMAYNTGFKGGISVGLSK